MTEHAPEQLDAEFQVEKLTPDLVSKIIRQDITQPEILSQISIYTAIFNDIILITIEKILDFIPNLA